MVEESFSGFRKEGEWEEVVEHGQKITDALRSSGVEESDLDEWEEWRPKHQEELQKEMAEKTAEKASVKPEEAQGGIEEKAKDVIKEIEKTVYEKVMAKSGHQYFENELISANIKSKGRVVGGNQDFSFEVDIHEEEPKEDVRESLTRKH